MHQQRVDEICAAIEGAFEWEYERYEAILVQVQPGTWHVPDWEHEFVAMERDEDD